ncbi:uncharacterized protein LOC114934623 [Nylanderia fulva]|uniref:uncharacterized protein LOC114934623 n=1 Tax=Nylanderia fulva TaxID=613905 RepID=UPI0010FBB9F7|nr:uncharacterized protein LOC114934623 [Nylanderia fulva]
MSSIKKNLEETSSENSENDMKVLFNCHCRTTLNYYIFEYTWNIADFWTIFKFLSNLTTPDTGNLPFKIRAYFDKKNDTVRFFSCSIGQIKFYVNFYIHIQTIKGPKMAVSKENVYLNNDKFIYGIDLACIRDEITIYIPNNTLAVYFKFEIPESVSHKTIYETMLESHTSMLNTFVLNESDSFVTFVVEEKHISINKSLLCSKSNVFEVMINNAERQVKENENLTIELCDITYDVLKHLLLYIKTGNLDNLNDLKENVDYNIDTVTDIVYSLIVAGNNYNIKDLILSCEKLLIRNTSENNVVKHLHIAHVNNAKLLENYAIRFIKLYENSIVKKSCFKILMDKYPNLLINIQEVKLNTVTIPIE